MSQEAFNRFWDIAKTWRPNDTQRPGAAAREFHRRVKEGVDPEEIVRGAQVYTEHYLSAISYPTAPHNWLIDWSWQSYQDKPLDERPLTPAEQRTYELAFRVPPRRTNKPLEEWAGLGPAPKLRAVS